MKLFLKKAVKNVVFCILLAAMILSLDSFLRLEDAESLCRDYFRYPHNTFDVVFLGSSLTMFGIQPMELYRQYGIASYSLCSANQPMKASYYLAREVIERDHPSLIVLDVGRAFADDTHQPPAFFHYMTDVMPPFSENRIRIITELTPREKWTEFFFPLYVYHTRWEEISEKDARPAGREAFYGARTTGYRRVSKRFQEPVYIDNAISPTSLEDLRLITELCRETGTSLMFLSMPVPAENIYFGQSGYDLRWSAARDITGIAEKEGIPYLNYVGREKEFGIDVETEVSDGEHLNRWGAEKVTADVGAYLHDHFSLPDRRGSGGIYSKMDQDADAYPLERMKTCLQAAPSLRHVANILAEDLHTQPVKDTVVLMALGSKIDSHCLDHKSGERLKGIGISRNLSDWKGHGWIAVIDQGRVVYETDQAGPGMGWVPEEGISSPDDSTAKNTDSPDFADIVEGTSGCLKYRITSGKAEEDGQQIRDDISITVNGLGYALDGGGLQIAVFNRETGELLDACRIDTGKGDLPCTHDSFH